MLRYRVCVWLQECRQGAAPVLLGDHDHVHFYAEMSSANSQIESEWLLVINLETLCW